MAEESEGVKVLLNEYLEITRKELLGRASEFVTENGQLNVIHVSKAIEEHAGNKLPEAQTWRSYFPPVAVLCAVLAFFFAVLGLWAILGTGAATKLGGQGFLDIAKIFAGAIVGSATAATVTSRKRVNK